MAGPKLKLLWALGFVGALAPATAEALCSIEAEVRTVWELDLIGCSHPRPAIVRGWLKRGLSPQPAEVAKLVKGTEFVVVAARVVRSNQVRPEHQFGRRTDRSVASGWIAATPPRVREFLVPHSGERLCESVELGRRVLLQASGCDDTPAFDAKFVTGLPVLRELPDSLRWVLEGHR